MEIPKIPFRKYQDLYVEVLDLEVLTQRLEQSDDHDPFSVHKIEFYLILVITENSYSHFLDFHTYHLSKGSAIFIAKNQIHQFSKTIKNTKGYCIIFNSDFLDKYYYLSRKIQLDRLFNYHIESPLLHKEALEQNNFLELVHQLYEEYNLDHDFGKSEILGSLLNVILLKAERVKVGRAVDEVNSRWLDLFGQFKNLLENNYTQTRSSRAYAQNLNISYKLLNDIVKKLSGKTAKSFIDAFVSIEIKRYLVSTGLSIKEISFKTGFEEPANMIKFFKKHNGSTPFAFREKI